MQFKAIVGRAKEISDKYSKLNQLQFGKTWQAEQYAQGFVGDVGDLMKLVMAKSGQRQIPGVDAKLSHELADCLWSVIMLADKYGVDLESSFKSTMDDLEKYLDKQLSGK